MNKWIAFYRNGENIYSDNYKFKDLNKEQLLAFSLIFNNRSIYVNLDKGFVAIDGKILKEEEIENTRKNNIKEKIDLVYFIRAFIDFYVCLENQDQKEEIEYIACGWEGKYNKILFKVFPSGEHERIITEKN